MIPIGIVVGLAIGGVLLDRQRHAKQSSLSGVFESQPTKVAGRVAGRVIRILVKEGDRVKRGQVLVELDATPDKESALAAASAAEQAMARLRLAQKGPRSEDIERQEAVVAELSANLSKLENGSLPEEIAIARQRVAESRAKYELAVRGPREEDLSAARASVDEAEQRLRQAERGLTQEERAQIQARNDSAAADAANARREAVREQRLYQQGASSRQASEAAEARALQAEARARETEQALRRADRGTPHEELAQVRFAYQRAKAQYQALRNGTRKEDVRAAQAGLVEAEESLKLVQRGPRAEDVRAARARLRQASAALKALRRGTRPEEVAESAAALAAAGHQASSAESKSKEGQVLAPTDGQIERILIADGDLVPAGQELVRMSDTRDIWLRVYVPESALAKIKVGDPAVLSVDGVANEVRGIVEAVSSQGEFTPANLQTPEERGRQVFAVRIRQAQVDERVKAGMAATVRSLGQWP